MKRLLALFTVMLLATMTVAAAQADEAGSGNAGEGEPAAPTPEGPGEPFLEYTTTVQIEPGDDFHVTFRMGEPSLNPKPPARLPDECVDALEMSPAWLRDDLEHKFRQVGGEDRVSLANTILDSPEPEYVDEIAFVAAHLARENIRDDSFFFELITHNAELIYEAEGYLPYVKLVEYDDHTTIKYRNGNNNWKELDRDMYYWYVVHPKLSDELPTYVDPDYDFTSDPPFDRNHGTPPPVGRYWRDWLFNGNDTGGYPILRERLSGANTIWEAISACNGWMGASMSFTSDQERPVQPVRIYKKHIGRCGEYQDMRNAIARAGLIPSTCTMNSAEDHVWNEFWDGRWIHWDGDTDNPRKYENGWGKTISSVWNSRGDGYIWSVSEKYTDVCTFTGEVLDGSGMPVDGALVRISTENFYNPDLMTTTTWGVTDYTGNAVIPLGDGRNFWAEADTDDLGDDPFTGEEEVITGSETGVEYSHTFEVPMSADALRIEDAPLPGTDYGRYLMEVDFEVEENILSYDNAYTGEHGDLRGPGGDIDFFIADQDNFERYNDGRTFEGYHYNERSGGAHVSLVLPQEDNHHVVLSNAFSQASSKFVNVTVRMYAELEAHIIYPEDNDGVYNLGSEILFKGYAWSPVGVDTAEFSVDGNGIWTEVIDLNPDEPWSNWYFWVNTTEAGLGAHNVEIRAVDSRDTVYDSMNFTVIDGSPPSLDITSPADKTFHDRGAVIAVEGTAADNMGIASLWLWLDDDTGDKDNITYTLSDGFWGHSIDTTSLDYGPHSFTVMAYDTAGNTATAGRSFQVTESEDPEVTIHTPGDGSLHRAGDTVTVSGTAFDDNEVGTVELTFNGDNPADVTPSLDDDGRWSYSWDSPSSSSDDGEHVIRAKVFDTFGNSASHSITVMLDGEDPEGSFTSPERGMLFGAGDDVVFTGTALDAHGIGSVTLTFDDGEPVDITRSVWQGEWSWDEWRSYDVESGEHTVLLTITDTVGHEVTDTTRVVIDAEGPMVTIAEVEDPVQVGDYAALRGTATDDIGVAKVTIELGRSEAMDITNRLKGDGWSYNWDTTGLDEGRHTVTVTVTDEVGNTAEEDISVDVTYGSGGGGGGDGAGGDGDDGPGGYSSPLEGDDDESGLKTLAIVAIVFLLILVIASAVFKGKKR